jgi:hypothetical protein
MPYLPVIQIGSLLDILDKFVDSPAAGGKNMGFTI